MQNHVSVIECKQTTQLVFTGSNDPISLSTLKVTWSREVGIMSRQLLFSANATFAIAGATLLSLSSRTQMSVGRAESKILSMTVSA